MVDYSWELTRLETKPKVGKLADVVVAIRWRLWATDGVRKACTEGAVNLGAVDAAKFVGFGDITRDWIRDRVEALLADQLPGLRSGLARQLAQFAVTAGTVAKASPALDVARGI